MGTDSGKHLFTASEVARFCQVDLKTIHNWADKGEIRHFRTPGRHLRFRRVDVLDFLRRYGYPVPDVLLAGKPRVVVVDTDEPALAKLREALETQFEVTGYGDIVDALVSIGSEAPDLIVLDAYAGRVDNVHSIGRLRNNEATRHIRIVVYSQEASIKGRCLDAGAAAFVDKPDLDALRGTLLQLMGVSG